MSKPISSRIFHFLAMGLLVTLLGGQLTAQPVLLLKSQAEVDSVPILYPNLTEVYALSIGYLGQTTTLSDIHDLGTLSSIQRITADLSIRNNPHLTSLHGLHNIDSIFGNIYSRIANNDSLTDLSELQVKYIGEELQIMDNDRLESLVGLEGITELNILAVSGNPDLTNLDGLANLKKVRKDLSFSSNGISNIDLPALQYVGGLGLNNEPNLVSLTGLSSLDSIGNFENIANNNYILLYELPVLGSLQGLEGVHIAPGTGVNISDNPMLQDLELLATAQVEYLAGLSIHNNPLLQDISCPSVHAIARLEITNNQGLKSIFLPNLDTLDAIPVPSDYSGVKISENSSLVEIYMPKLGYVGIMDFSGESSFQLDFNDSLESIGTWGDNLVVQGEIVISHNASLINLDGIKGLKKVGGNFEVSYNLSLQSFCDFTQFVFIEGGLYIYNDTSLISLGGLETLEFVGTRIWLDGDSMLVDIASIYGIDSIGWNEPFTGDHAGLDIWNLHSLKKINFSGVDTKLFDKNRINIGFCPNLDTLVVSFVEDSESIWVQENPNLKMVSFPNIKRIGLGGYNIPSFILQNNSLSTIDGISSIITIKDAEDALYIKDNPLLTDCEAICRILDRGQTLPSRFFLGGNAFPCNSVEEVEAHICDTLTAVHFQAGLKETTPLLTMPNPTTGTFTIVLPAGHEVASLCLFDGIGRMVFKAQPANMPVDIRHLTSGLYFAKITDQRGCQFQGRVVKQ